MNINYINIIDPGTRTPEIDCFNYMVAQTPLKLTYHLPALYGSDSLKTWDNPRGIIILGSGASPTEKSLWQTQLASWLQQQWQRDVATLGICYGHQLIAHMLRTNGLPLGGG